MATTTAYPSRPPQTLAERFWGLARVMHYSGDRDPANVVEHVLAVLDRFDAGISEDLTVHTVSFVSLLRQQQRKGDILYASPEQARGECMDERSLVFSVGVLLFEKLTGRHPFGAEGNPNRLNRIRRGELASGVNYFPQLPEALRAVLMRAMGPFPDDRYESLAIMRRDLESFLAGKLVHSRELPALPNVPGDRGERNAPATRTTAGRTRIACGSGGVPIAKENAAQRDRGSSPVAVHSPAAADHTLAPAVRWAPIAWMLAGAVIACTAFAAVGFLPVSSSPLGGQAAGPVALAIGGVEMAGVGGSAVVAGAGVNGTAPVAEELLNPSSVPGVFDADYAGDNALAAATGCFDDERLSARANFGVSLVFRADGPEATKVYFGANDALTSAERQCLSESLVGVSAGRAPDAPTVVHYQMWLGADGGRFRARIK